MHPSHLQHTQSCILQSINWSRLHRWEAAALAVAPAAPATRAWRRCSPSGPPSPLPSAQFGELSFPSHLFTGTGPSAHRRAAGFCSAARQQAAMRAPARGGRGGGFGGRGGAAAPCGGHCMSGREHWCSGALRGGSEGSWTAFMTTDCAYSLPGAACDAPLAAPPCPLRFQAAGAVVLEAGLVAGAASTGSPRARPSVSEGRRHRQRRARTQLWRLAQS